MTYDFYDLRDTQICFIDVLVKNTDCPVRNENIELVGTRRHIPMIRLVLTDQIDPSNFTQIRHG